MASRNEQATATVNLDGKNAADELSRLQTKAKDLTAQMRKLKDANDHAGIVDLQKELKQTNADMKQLRINVYNVDVVMKNLAGSSLKQLQQAQKALNNEISNTTRNTAEERKQLELKQNQLKLVDAEIKKVRANMQLAGTAQKSWLSGAADGFNKYVGLIASAGAALAGIQFTFRKAVDASNEFQQKVANLSSLTGLQGADLKFLEDAAKSLSVTTTDSGVRITKSANDIVEAFTKVGGKRPELLANKDALMAVTREALILAEAAQIDLDQAILTVSASMNMFNLQGNDAARITNALAAGSKVGSAEVDYLGTAILKAGTGFQMAGLSFEESVGIVEGIAPAFVSAEQAGTNLQSFLLKLEAQNNNNFKPSIVGINGALDNLAAANLTTAQFVKMFGIESSDIAPIMINNRDAIENFTKAVTGTNTAVDQARITTATNKAALQQARNEVELNAIALGDSLAPVMTKVTMGFSDMVRILKNVVEWGKRNAGIIVFLAKAVTVATTAIFSYNAAVKLAAFFTTKQGEATAFSILMTKLKAAAEVAATAGTLLYQAAVALLSGKLTMAAQSMRLFTVALAANPIGLAVAAVTAAVVAFQLFSDSANDAESGVESLIGVQKKFNAAMGETYAKLKAEFDQLKKTNPASKERKDLIDQINSTYGTTLKNLSDENAFIKQVDASYDSLLKKMAAKILIESTEADRIDLLKRQFDLQTAINDLSSKEGADGMLGSAAINAFKTDLANVNAALGMLDSKRDQIAKNMGLDLSQSFTTPTGTGGGTGNAGGGTLDEDAQKKALDKLQEFTKKVIDQQDKLYRDTLLTRAKAIADVKAKYADDIALAAKYENDVTDVGREWHKVRIGLERNRDEEILRLNKEHDKRLRDSFIAARKDLGLSRDEAYNLELADLRDKLAAETITVDEYYLRIKALQQKAADEGLKIQEDSLKKRADLMAKYGIAPADTQQGDMAALEADVSANPEVWTTELVEQAKLKIIEKYAKMREDVEQSTQSAITDKYRQGVEIAQEIIGGFTSYFQTSKDTELAAAGDNEAKKKEITKRYANIEMAIKIAQTLANIAMGIADIWAKFGTNPVAATILSALMVGNAAAQIGLAQAQKDKIQGYAGGLYPVQDHNGQSYNAAMGGSPSTQMVSKPTVFLAGEQGRNFPEMIIDGPTFKRLQINYPEAITAINRSRTPGFAAGNYPAQAAAPAAPAIPAEFYAVIMELNNTLKGGISAPIIWTDIQNKNKVADFLKESFGELPTKY